MTKTIHAVYEHGVLKLSEPLEGIPERTEVIVTLVQKAVSQYPWERVCGILPKEDADEMRRIVEAEFETVNLDEW